MAKRPKQNKRIRKLLNTYPTAKDLTAAIKLARKVDPVLAQMVEAERVKE